MKTARHKPRVFLTGASSGIGKATALLLIEEGYEVWGTSRDSARLASIAGIHALEMDFAVKGSVEKAWQKAIEEAGAIDVVIQNAGCGLFGSIEETSLESSREQWVSLVEGPLVLMKLASAHLRPRGSGWIIGVSSLAAEMPIPFFADYSAGKAAFSSYLAGLWMELKPFGVHVVDFRPGDIKTAFNDAVAQALPPDSPYRSWAWMAWKESCRLINAAPEPAKAARSLLRMLEHEGPPPAVRRCGSFFQAFLGALGVRFLPHRILLESIRRYYRLDKLK